MTDYAKWDLSLRDCLNLAAAAAAGGLAVGWLFYDNLIIGLASAAVCIVFIPKYKEWKIQNRQKELLLQFRDFLYSAASSVSAGRNMTQAMEEALQFWEGTYSQEDMIMQELQAMVRKIRESNTGEAEVFRDFAERSGLEDIMDFVMVYESCRGSGANLVQAVNRAASVIGDKITLERELHVMMAQKKFESRIIMGAPFVMLFFLKLFSPEYLLPLTVTSQGRMISTIALFLIGIACVMMERVNHFEF